MMCKQEVVTDTHLKYHVTASHRSTKPTWAFATSYARYTRRPPLAIDTAPTTTKPHRGDILPRHLEIHMSGLAGNGLSDDLPCVENSAPAEAVH